MKGKLESDDSRTCLTANINGRVFKSWLVDQEGTIHLFTKVLLYRVLIVGPYAENSPFTLVKYLRNLKKRQNLLYCRECRIEPVKGKRLTNPTLLFHFPFACHRFQFLSCNTFARAYGSCFLNQPCCCHKLYFYARVFLLQLLEY